MLHPPERMTKEIELKLEIEPGDVAAVHGHTLLAEAAGRANAHHTVYFDTPSGTLRQHGFTLRVRSSGDRFIQAIKPLSQSAGLMSRAEIERAVPSLEPDVSALAGTPLEPLLDARRLDGLKPVIRTNVRRTSWMVEIGGSSIQFDFDEGEITAGGQSQQFDELELELLSGDPAALVVAARTIAERVPVRLGVLSKAERGERVANAAFTRIAKSAPVNVGISATVAEAFEVILHACLKHYRLNEPLVLRERKKEALHQCRVAMRRLRAAFSLFKSAIEDVEYHYLRQELRWFTAQLGDARNLDVYLERGMSDADRAPLLVRREEAYDQVIAAMDSQRFRLLAIQLIGWTAFGPWRAGKQARKSVHGYASNRLDRLWDSIADGHRLADLDEHRRHQLRIQVKKMRYAIEFLRRLYPEADRAEKRFADAVEELQESLGKLNDLATARTLASAAPADQWLIGEPEERVHLRESEQAFRDLAAVGPFWRDGREGGAPEA